NCIIVCSIENIDPMGVHTGDSITVAPALTLTDKEYQIMRNASIAVLREIGVETGGSNLQVAGNPPARPLVILRMNPPRVASGAAAQEDPRFSYRQAGGKSGGRLAGGRVRQHIRGGGAARLFRADHRLRGDKDPALRLREISGREAGADHFDEIGGRSDGH